MNETALENLCKLKFYLKETCLWLVLAGVIGPENEFPDNEYFRVGHFKDFYIPEMKLPLRYAHLNFINMKHLHQSN